DGEHAVALQGRVRRTAVRATAPRVLERGPLLVAEIVLDAVHPALASPRRPDLATSSPRHRRRVCTARLPVRRSFRAQRAAPGPASSSTSPACIDSPQWEQLSSTWLISPHARWR